MGLICLPPKRETTLFPFQKTFRGLNFQIPFGRAPPHGPFENFGKGKFFLEEAFPGTNFPGKKPGVGGFSLLKTFFYFPPPSRGGLPNPFFLFLPPGGASFFEFSPGYFPQIRKFFFPIFSPPLFFLKTKEGGGEKFFFLSWKERIPPIIFSPPLFFLQPPLFFFSGGEGFF